MNISENFIIGLGIQKSILNKFGMATCTGEPWDLNDFVAKILEDPGVKKFDVYRLTDEEMAMLGFAPSGDGRNIRLIPTWIYQFLPEQLYVYGAGSDEPVFKKRSDLEMPVQGFFGFGILPHDKQLRDEQVVTPKVEVAVPKED